jgi:hypothetical protein
MYVCIYRNVLLEESILAVAMTSSGGMWSIIAIEFLTLSICIPLAICSASPSDTFTQSSSCRAKFNSGKISRLTFLANIIRSSMAPSALGVRYQKLGNSRSSDEWPKFYYIELLHASEGTLSRSSQLHLKSLSSTITHLVWW